MIALRRVWWRLLRRYGMEMCQRCGRPVHVVWQASDQLWLEVEGGPGGIRCVRCFDRDCEERGITVYWRPEVSFRH